MSFSMSLSMGMSTTKGTIMSIPFFDFQDKTSSGSSVTLLPDLVNPSIPASLEKQEDVTVAGNGPDMANSVSPNTITTSAIPVDENQIMLTESASNVHDEYPLQP